MGLLIGTNIASLRSQRLLNESHARAQNIGQQLASGQRINKASDDSASLAIVSALNNDTRVFTQGVRNLNDGISLLSIADGAISQLVDITTSLVELAEQSSNGVLSSSQRNALDQEAQALKKEYLRIIQSTTFNNRAVLTSELGELRLQDGYGVNGGIAATLGGKVGNGTFGTGVSYASGGLPIEMASGDLNYDGKLDVVAADLNNPVVRVLLGDGSGGFSASVSYAATGTGMSDVTLGDLNNDGILDLVASQNGGSGIIAKLGDGLGGFGTNVSLTAGTNVAHVTLADFNGDGNLDIANTDGGSASFSIFLGAGNGTFGARTSFATGTTPAAISTGDVNKDGKIDIVATDWGGNTVSVYQGLGNGTFGTRVSYASGGQPASVNLVDLNNDGWLDFFSTNRAGSSISVWLNDKTGNFGTQATYSTPFLPYDSSFGDYNGDGNLDISVGHFNATPVDILLGNGNGSFSAYKSYYNGQLFLSLLTDDFNNDGVDDVVTGDGIGSVSVLLGNTTAGTAPLLDFSLKSLTDSKQALSIFQNKLEHLTSQRSQIGAFESRLATATSVLTSRKENLAMTQSQIMDVDIAEKSAGFVREKVLQEISTSILGQANLQPDITLKLLNNL